jgi:hypothetical protein
MMMLSKYYKELKRKGKYLKKKKLRTLPGTKV